MIPGNLGACIYHALMLVTSNVSTMNQVHHSTGAQCMHIPAVTLAGCKGIKAVAKRGKGLKLHHGRER